MPINLDFSGTEDKDFSPVPPGKYPATIISAKVGTSRTNNPKLEITYKVDDGQPAGSGRQFWDNPSLQPQALWKLKALLVKLGFEFPEDQPFEFEEQELVGKKVVLTIGMGTWDGKPSNEIVDVELASSQYSWG